MNLYSDQRMLEAILCTLVAQAGGTVTLHVPVVAACGTAYQLSPETNRDEQTITLTVEEAPAPPARERPRPKRVGSPLRLPTRRH